MGKKGRIRCVMMGGCVAWEAVAGRKTPYGAVHIWVFQIGPELGLGSTVRETVSSRAETIFVSATGLFGFLNAIERGS